jgi:hypothetical protein
MRMSIFITDTPVRRPAGVTNATGGNFFVLRTFFPQIPNTPRTFPQLCLARLPIDGRKSGTVISPVFQQFQSI